MIKLIREFPAAQGQVPRRIFLMTDAATDFGNLPTQTVAKNVMTYNGAVSMLTGLGSEADTTDSAHPCILDSTATWNKWGWV